MDLQKPGTYDSTKPRTLNPLFHPHTWRQLPNCKHTNTILLLKPSSIEHTYQLGLKFSPLATNKPTLNLQQKCPYNKRGGYNGQSILCIWSHTCLNKQHCQHYLRFLFNLECFADLDGLINRYMKRPTMVTTITRGPYFTASFCTNSIALHLDFDFHCGTKFVRECLLGAHLTTAPSLTLN
jgi:hypothetical protein